MYNETINLIISGLFGSSLTYLIIKKNNKFEKIDYEHIPKNLYLDYFELDENDILDAELINIS